MNKNFATLCLISIVTIMATASSNEMEGYIEKIKSADPNAQDDALGYFEHLASKTDVPLPADLSRSDIEGYLKRWGGNSDKAALLLGRIGHQESISLLTEMKTQAEQIENKADAMDHRNNLAPKVSFACLKALLRLKDDGAREEVVSLLASSDVESRVKGVECISYANDKTFVPNLATLLDDKRDAVNVAPSGAIYYIRVCDLAVNAITSVGQAKTSFDVQYGARYSDEQLAEVRLTALQIN